MNKLILVVTLILLTGCATPYSCGQFPETGCKPVSEVYRHTNENFHDYRSELNNKGNNKERKNVKQLAPVQPKLTHNMGDPILTKPLVMRVLINAWEDKGGDLNAGGFIYLRIKDSEWQLKE